jgi:hypothetical protein
MNNAAIAVRINQGHFEARFFAKLFGSLIQGGRLNGFAD